MKINIIIDSPRRDLRGHIFLTSILSRKYDVYLIYNYHLFEIFLNKPDLVIFHNCRPMHHQYLNICKDVGIKTAILDTEGAQLGPNNEDLKYFASVVKDSYNLYDLYFLWGQRQLIEIKKNLKKDQLNEKFFITNNPRFDLYKKENRKFIKIIKKNTKIIVFNTNFAWVSPRYTSIKQELDVGVSEFYNDTKKAYIKLESERKLYHRFIDTIEYVSSNFPEFKIIINPHPFESNLQYKKISKKYKNIFVFRDIFLPKLLLNADYIISYNCQTCVDSFFLDKKTISINYIDENNSLSDYFREICLNVEKKENLLDIMLNQDQDNHNLDSFNIKHLFANKNASYEIYNIIDKFFKDNVIVKNYNFKNKLKLLKLIFFNKGISGYRVKLKLFYLSGIVKLILIFLFGLRRFFEIKALFLNNYKTKKTNINFINSNIELYSTSEYIVENPKSQIFKTIFGNMSSFKIIRKS